MTDASFIDRMGTDPVIDRVAPPRRVRRRVVDDFQLAWKLSPKTYDVRWWTANRIAEVCLVGFVTACVFVMLSVKAARALSGWLR